MPLLTFGHGKLDQSELSTLISNARIARVVDVRRFPGSRANAAASRDNVRALMTTLGGDYFWEERLGGRRKLRKEESAQSPDTWWRVEAFRAYASWTRTEDFETAMRQLITDAASTRTAVMCAESVWWRCHRRLIADVAVLVHEVPVQHLMHSGKTYDHVPSEGAEMSSAGQVVWDR